MTATEVSSTMEGRLSAWARPSLRPWADSRAMSVSIMGQFSQWKLWRRPVAAVAAMTSRSSE